ncbi:MAG TPA: DNA repair protein RecO [Gemmatimonadaceae bacterium]|nr:DNA repair protein RecO [Gemmatimonadaceae bacterium]
MATLVTEALVLHAFDYLETSRIIRLMTREAGIQSVLARGARNSRKRFGSAVDLFAQGTAEIQMKPNRELQVLASLEVTRARAGLALDVGRFTAASMMAELALRASSDEPAPALFDVVEMALDRLAVAPSDETIDAALAGAWHMIATLGFTPALDVCANCHAPLDPVSRVSFSHSAGGALCPRCSADATGSRVLPPAARNALREWMDGGRAPALDRAASRAHQRLLREFVQEHMGSDRELRAYRVWEQGAWTAA